MDYAHNRLSFEKLFQSVKAEYPGQRVVIVFGCPGKKALDRRKDLSEISAQYADLVIITEEDPGEEDVLDISREMAAYVEAGGCDYSIEPDRGQAIRMAVMGCEEPTVILITGKDKAEVVAAVAEEPVEVPDISKMKLDELKEFAEDNGIDLTGCTTKASILQKIREYEADAAAAAAIITPEG